MDRSETASPRAQRQRAKRQQSQQEILDAALLELAVVGLNALTLGAVADRVGVTKPALYYYFPNKEALLAALAEREARQMVETLIAQVDAAEDGKGALEAVVRAFVALFRDRFEAFRLLFLWPQVVAFEPELVQQKINPMMRELFARIEARLDADRRRGALRDDLHPRRAAVVGFLGGLSIISLLGIFAASGTTSLHDEDDLVDEMCAILLRGIVARGR